MAPPPLSTGTLAPPQLTHLTSALLVGSAIASPHPAPTWVLQRRGDLRTVAPGPVPVIVVSGRTPGKRCWVERSSHRPPLLALPALQPLLPGAGPGQPREGPPPRPSWDPPLPAGASLQGAGVQHAASVAEGEAAGLPGLREHCRGRRSGSALRASPSPQPTQPEATRTASRCPGRFLPDPPWAPGLLLEGAPLVGDRSSPPRGPSASTATSGALVAGVLGVPGIVGPPRRAVALGPGGSVPF